MFAFDLYDTDADGALTEIEVKVLFHDLYWYGIEYREDEKSRRFFFSLFRILFYALYLTGTTRFQNPG